VQDAGFLPDAGERLGTRHQVVVKDECRSHAHQYA
jgi:hypothetical protein